MKLSGGLVLLFGAVCVLGHGLEGNVRRDTSSSPTSTAPSPSGTPFITFTVNPDIADGLSTCQSVALTWVYRGPESPMSLTVTNIGVPQDGTPPSSSTVAHTNTFTDVGGLSARSIPTQLAGGKSAAAVTVAQLLSGNIDPSASTYTWSSVNIPQGWYRILASMDAYPTFVTTTGSDFYVANGSDVSCLPVTASSSTSSSPSTTMSSTSTSSTPSASATQILAVGGSSVNKGAIAGGVVGGLAVIAAFLAAYIFFICAPARRRRRRASIASQTPRGPKGIMGKWGALGSFDSTHSKKTRAEHGNAAHADGSPVMDNTRQNSHGPIMSMSTVEDYDPYALNEKPTEGIIPIGYSPPRSTPMRQSQSSGSSESYAMYPTRPYSTNGMMQTFPESPRPSTTDVVADTPPSRRASMVLGEGEAGTKRQSSRRTPRKPVPSYAADAGEPQVLPSAAGTPSSTYQAPTPLSSYQSGPSNVHLSRDPSPTASVEAVHQLIHKGSFGDGRPVHVLMPDMPVAQN